MVDRWKMMCYCLVIRKRIKGGDCMKTKRSLKEIREASGCSKLEYAKLLNIPYTTYVRYENNLGAAPFGIVAKFCDFLQLKIEDIEC